MTLFNDWIRQRLADRELVMLMASLLGIFLLLVLLVPVLTPLLLAIALAYVFDGVIGLLTRCKLPRMLAIGLTGGGALLLLLFALLAVLPLLTEQIGRLVTHAPQNVQSLREMLHQVQANHAEWINPDYLQQIIATLATKMQEWGGALLKFSIASIPGMITLLVYAVLVPVLVFFLLKDKQLIMSWSQQFLPAERALLQRVWAELDTQIGNYIRGKFWEAFVIGFGMWLVYWWMGHDYALLLGVLTGLSVWIPFVGMAVVTVPVVLLSFFQWGWSDTMAYSVLAYIIVQAIDANVIVPWLFSEIVNLHPIAIIVAILVFGSLWGIIGVIVAIPMAALVKSVVSIVLERRAGGTEPEKG
ncbi:MAG: AI-2E family transporter [Zetaproteobacteria bacterium CG12_big_fil_rev_8_21_14_0_65_54_13]|nr:MAG: permease [Zetaproteobacteria bacterium CG23_combo_of_CG06-09_8_20_14_all_54_7]PIW51408.1 MAG: AI-2E family transporter [Zetaproteobacteria bacterium CG12_big_fil_rev_8_21_14_0_65_54_13]PIX55729.1 MAG: AI-2E family transporter [Zetaproteobacteria bacterium CG_4_10_14_3_um_filter_54_28]PJA30541.1 MAG: AI-2E family transporter [Zetaproteobacteria bacterium CG_4_9_14_3_um_filter_54_145]